MYAPIVRRNDTMIVSFGERVTDRVGQRELAQHRSRQAAAGPFGAVAIDSAWSPPAVVRRLFPQTAPPVLQACPRVSNTQQALTKEQH